MQLSTHPEKSQTKLGYCSGKLSQPFQYSLSCILRAQTDFKFNYVGFEVNLKGTIEPPKDIAPIGKGLVRTLAAQECMNKAPANQSEVPEVHAYMNETVIFYIFGRSLPSLWK